MPRISLALTVPGVLLLLFVACAGPKVADGDVKATGPMALKAEQLVDGAPFDLVSLRGKVCLVDVWASWCAPCRRALPFFAALHGRHAGAGFEVVALSVDDERSVAKAFVADLKLPFVLLWDRDQKAVSGLDVPKMPTSFLVDRKGKVRAMYAGFKDADRAVIERQVAALLAEPTAGTGG